VLQSSSSNYDESALLSQEEIKTLYTIIDTLHNIQKQLIPGPGIRELMKLNVSGGKHTIDMYIGDLGEIFMHLEDLKEKPLPPDLPLSIGDTFAKSIETIYILIRDAIKHLNMAVGNAEEFNRIQLNGQVAEKDAKDINTNNALFQENVERCRQLLKDAEKKAVVLKIPDTVPNNPTEKAG